MSAPQNNTNAMTHGCRRSRDAAYAGHRGRRLPKGFKYVAEESSRFAAALYREVESFFGAVNREQMEIIESAAAWHQHALYVLRVMRIDHDALKPETRVQFSGEVAKAAQKRADLVKLLKLNDAKPDDFWNGTPPLPGGPATDGSQNGQGSPPEASPDSAATPANEATTAAVGDPGGQPQPAGDQQQDQEGQQQ